MWDRLKAAFKHSVTILWARLVAFTDLLLASGQALIADPNINDAIHAVLKPGYIPYYVIAIGLITELCRRRAVSKET